ncbi:MAG: tripartite tricarboxylate transporter TctB family protein [Deltaproteobacteria bacterium]|nr:tripartite tricarboxylate transporter TctB family protein [Deltaproteobacteria bacterium]
MVVHEHWSSWFWVLVGVVIAALSTSLGIGSFANPGAGLMPFLAGLLIAILGVVDLIATYRAKKKVVVGVPEKEAAKKMVVATGALVAYSLLMPTLGFSLTTMALMVVLFRYTEAISWKVSLVTAFTVTAAAYLIFSRLGTELPKGILF